jgi:hypothetical protein
MIILMRADYAARWFDSINPQHLLVIMHRSSCGPLSMTGSCALDLPARMTMVDHLALDTRIPYERLLHFSMPVVIASLFDLYKSPIPRVMSNKIKVIP